MRAPPGDGALTTDVCRVTSDADDYFVTDFVAWKVAFDNVVVVHAPVFNVTLRVVVTV